MQQIKRQYLNIGQYNRITWIAVLCRAFRLTRLRTVGTLVAADRFRQAGSRLGLGHSRRCTTAHLKERYIPAPEYYRRAINRVLVIIRWTVHASMLRVAMSAPLRLTSVVTKGVFTGNCLVTFSRTVRHFGSGVLDAGAGGLSFGTWQHARLRRRGGHRWAPGVSQHQPCMRQLAPLFDSAEDRGRVL